MWPSHAAAVFLATLMGFQVEPASQQTLGSDAFDRENGEFYRFGRDFVLYRPLDSDSLLAQSWAFRLPSQQESEPVDDDELIRGRRQFYRFGRAPEKRFLRFGRSRHSAVQEDGAAAEAFSEFETLSRRKRSSQDDLESHQSLSRMQRSVEATRKKPEDQKSRDVSDNLEHAEMQNQIKGEHEQTYLGSRDLEEPGFEKRFMRFGKRFMRFGRGDEGDLAEDKRFITFGKRLSKDDTDLDKRFMRFGKSGTYFDDKDKRFMRFGKSIEDDDKDKRFMRFGKSAMDYDTDKRFMRFGKSVGDDEKDKRFMRFGKSTSENSDTEKRFMRFGKSIEPLVSEEDKRFMRFGKRFMRFGKRFMRFGRGDEDILANSDERTRDLDVVRQVKMQR